MLKKIIAFVIIAYLPVITVMFVGCAEEESYAPRISGIVSSLHHSGQEQTVYKHKSYSSSVKKNYDYTPASNYGWIPAVRQERKWQAIIIHHSATVRGSAASIDDYHRNHNGWAGVGYDFVIGNGTLSGNGKVEPTFRWNGQKIGAHCKTDKSNWANRYGIGICLVGNFDQTKPTYRQKVSLAKLVRFLADRYGIDVSKIYGHNTTPGHSTDTACPGKNFSVNYFKTTL